MPRGGVDVSDRLYKLAAETQRKKDQARRAKEHMELHVGKDGQELFKPKINKTKVRTRGRAGMDTSSSHSSHSGGNDNTYYDDGGSYAAEPPAPPVAQQNHIQRLQAKAQLYEEKRRWREEQATEQANSLRKTVKGIHLSIDCTINRLYY
jgi:hypothetical protein